MGLVVSSQYGLSNTLVVEGTEEEKIEAEGSAPEEELVKPELFKDLESKGYLKGETHFFTCKLSEEVFQFPTTFRPFPLQPKEKKFPLSLKESLAHPKEIKISEAHTERLDTHHSLDESGNLCQKIHFSARESLKKGAHPPSIAYLKETAAIKQQHTQARVIEHQMKDALKQKTHLHKDRENIREASESRQPHKNQEREAPCSSTQKWDKNEEREQQQHSHKRKREEEEGFAEGDRNRQSFHDDEASEHENYAIKSVEGAFKTEFERYAAQESAIISEILNMRVSQFDVLLLFIEILKLEIRSREQERVARRLERELQLMYMQKVVDNYKSQASWLMMSSLGSGILAIVSGICPLVGHLKGQWILDRLGSITDKFQSYGKDEFFKVAQKVTFAMSEMSKNTGQIHQTFSEGHRTYNQHMSELYRADWEESTRSMEEIKDSWKSIENFLYQTLQMYHEAVRQLYNH